MIIQSFSPEYASGTKKFVLDVLSGEGFDYDPLKDSDLDNIQENYILNGGVFYICLSEGKIVGTCAVKNLGSGICEIKRLYVKRECRGNGFGLTLFLKALGYAEDYYSCIRLKTDSALKKAIAIYKKNGFSIVKVNNGTVYFEKSV